MFSVLYLINWKLMMGFVGSSCTNGDWIHTFVWWRYQLFLLIIHFLFEIDQFLAVVLSLVHSLWMCLGKLCDSSLAVVHASEILNLTTNIIWRVFSIFGCARKMPIQLFPNIFCILHLTIGVVSMCIFVFNFSLLKLLYILLKVMDDDKL